MGKRRTGIIVAYSRDANAGVIRGVDGRRYLFFKKHWRSLGIPLPGENVVFYAFRKGRAAYVKLQTEIPAGHDQSERQVPEGFW